MRKWHFAVLSIFIAAWIAPAQEKPDSLLEKLEVAAPAEIPDASGAGQEEQRLLVEGTQSYNSGDLTNAIIDYQEAIQLNPNSSPSRRNLGVAYLAANKYDLAIASLEQASAIDPGSPEAWSYLGLAYYRLGKFDRARRCYKRAIQISPNRPAAHSNLGHVYLRLGRYTEAEGSFNTALRLNPRLPTAALGLCFVLSASGDRDQRALTSCRTALDLNPGSPLAQYLLGYAHLYRAQYTEALKLFEQTLKSEQTGLNYLALGRAQYKLADYDQALRNFARALKLQRGLSDAHIGKGCIYFTKRRFKEAIVEFERALEIDQESIEAHYNLGVTCLSQGRHDCALQQYNQLKILDSPLADKLFSQLFRGRILDARSNPG